MKKVKPDYIIKGQKSATPWWETYRNATFTLYYSNPNDKLFPIPTGIFWDYMKHLLSMRRI